MIAIVGNPRSGTSLTCLIHLKLLGEERLVGSKFMGADARIERRRANPEAMSPIRKYEYEKAQALAEESGQDPLSSASAARLAKMKDMNADGFWECPFTVGGMTWTQATAGLWDRIRRMKEEPFCKLVNSGIATTDPVHISRIVYINRHPREVAKSQEKLTGPVRDMLPPGEKIHSPDFYIQSTVQFCQWRVKHGAHIPLLMVDHNDLLEQPKTTVIRIALFHGVPHNNAWEAVREDLYRSKREDTPHPQFDDAIAIYEMMKRSDCQGVLDYYDNPKIATHKVNRQFRCHRIGRDVVLAECQNCLTKHDVKANFILRAERLNIEWEKEPCALECGALDPEGAISVEESVKNHSWIYESAKVGDAVERLIKITGLDRFKRNCKSCENRKTMLNQLFKRRIDWKGNEQQRKGAE